MEAREAFKRVSAAIKAAVDERECRQIYDELLHEWGESYCPDVDLVSRANADAVRDLKDRVQSRIAAVRDMAPT
jgi:hypothetical protein